MESAAHLQPMSGKGRHEGVVAGFCWEGELDGDRFTGLNEGGVGDDVGGLLRDVVFFDGLGVGDHGGGQGTDGVDFTGLDEDEVVGLLEGAVDVVEGEGDAGAGLAAEFGFVEGEGDLGVRSQFHRGRCKFLRAKRGEQGGDGDQSQQGRSCHEASGMGRSRWKSLDSRRIGFSSTFRGFHGELLIWMGVGERRFGHGH